MPRPKQYPTDLDFAEAIREVGNPELARVLESVMMEFERRGIHHLAIQQLYERLAHRMLALNAMGTK